MRNATTGPRLATLDLSQARPWTVTDIGPVSLDGGGALTTVFNETITLAPETLRLVAHALITITTDGGPAILGVRMTIAGGNTADAFARIEPAGGGVLTVPIFQGESASRTQNGATVQVLVEASCDAGTATAVGHMITALWGSLGAVPGTGANPAGP